MRVGESLCCTSVCLTHSNADECVSEYVRVGIRGKERVRTKVDKLLRSGEIIIIRGFP